MTEKLVDEIREEDQESASPPPASRQVDSTARRWGSCLLVVVMGIVLVCAVGTVAIFVPQLPGRQQTTPTPSPTPEHKVSMLELQRVAKLVSIEYFLVDEVHHTQVPDNVAQYLGFKKEFLALAYGTVVAGFDLTDWSLEDNLWRDGTRVMLKLPPPQVLYVDMDFERSHIVDTGSWCPGFICPEPVTEYLEKVLPKAEEKLKEQAIEYGLLEKTAISGRDYFYHFLKSLGFTEVRVVVDGYIYE